MLPSPWELFRRCAPPRRRSRTSRRPPPTPRPDTDATPTQTPTSVRPRADAGARAAPGSQIFVNTTTAGNQFFPVVAIGADEGFIVTWTSDAQDGDDSAIIGRRFDKTGAPLGGEFQVNVSTAGFQYLPAIASDPAGNFVVVWTSSPAYGESDVFGRRYDADGNALGGEFPVNTYTTGRQRLADVAMNADGFMVVWASEGQDGDEDGVYAPALCQRRNAGRRGVPGQHVHDGLPVRASRLDGHESIRRRLAESGPGRRRRRRLRTALPGRRKPDRRRVRGQHADHRIPGSVGRLDGRRRRFHRRLERLRHGRRAACSPEDSTRSETRWGRTSR